MSEKVLSIFVDESGRFQHPDSVSRFYILSMVFHNQAIDIPLHLKLWISMDESIKSWERICYHERKERAYAIKI